MVVVKDTQMIIVKVTYQDIQITGIGIQMWTVLLTTKHLIAATLT
jgi:hypothetical protein